jgi:hypothetical protein
VAPRGSPSAGASQPSRARHRVTTGAGHPERIRAGPATCGPTAEIPCPAHPDGGTHGVRVRTPVLRVPLRPGVGTRRCRGDGTGTARREGAGSGARAREEPGPLRRGARSVRSHPPETRRPAGGGRRAARSAGKAGGGRRAAAGGGSAHCSLRLRTGTARCRCRRQVGAARPYLGDGSNGRREGGSSMRPVRRRDGTPSGPGSRRCGGSVRRATTPAPNGSRGGVSVFLMGPGFWWDLVLGGDLVPGGSCGPESVSGGTPPGRNGPAHGLLAAVPPHLPYTSPPDARSALWIRSTMREAMDLMKCRPSRPHARGSWSTTQMVPRATPVWSMSGAPR